MPSPPRCATTSCIRSPAVLALLCLRTCSPQVEVVLTPESYSWVSKHVRFVSSLTIQAPLAIPPHCVPRYCQQVQVGTAQGFQHTCGKSASCSA